jgi:hypothetical protein
MRADPSSRIAYSARLGSSPPIAGFFSIAYRLAALFVPRSGAVLLASIFFYLA